MKTLEDVLEIGLRTFNDPKGILVPIETKVDCLIDIKRIFYIYSVPKGETRGKHSHIKTVQVLICTSGKCEVICDDGKNKKKYILDTPNKALYIPEGIWAEEKYIEKETVLMILCNTKYDIDDYIFDYNKFLKNKK